MTKKKGGRGGGRGGGATRAPATSAKASPAAGPQQQVPNRTKSPPGRESTAAVTEERPVSPRALTQKPSMSSSVRSSPHGTPTKSPMQTTPKKVRSPVQNNLKGPAVTFDPLPLAAPSPQEEPRPEQKAHKTSCCAKKKPEAEPAAKVSCCSPKKKDVEKEKSPHANSAPKVSCCAPKAAPDTSNSEAWCSVCTLM